MTSSDSGEFSDPSPAVLATNASKHGISMKDRRQITARLIVIPGPQSATFCGCGPLASHDSHEAACLPVLVMLRTREP